MPKALDYGSLYGLTEELQHLLDAQLQRAYTFDRDSLYLEFRLPQTTWQVAIGLKSDHPWIVLLDRPQAPQKKASRALQTPAVNFLKAHYVGKVLESISIAQKPNRTLRFRFRNGDDFRDFYFKCFPHQQQIILDADNKKILYPRHKNDMSFFDELESLSFIDPDKSESLEKSLELWDLVQPPQTSSAKNYSTQVAVEAVAPIIDKAEMKVLKAIESIEKALRNEDIAEKLESLENFASTLKNRGGRIGTELEKTYKEIQGLKRKKQVQADRLKVLKAKLKEMQSPAYKAAEQERLLKKAKQSNQPVFMERKKSWPGLQIPLDDTWELWVGRSAIQNDELIKAAHPWELWIHLRDYPGAHGLIRGPKNKQPPEHFIDRSCQIVAQFSQKKKSAFSEGDVLDFVVTARKFLRKKKGMSSGQVLVERETVRRVAYKTNEFTFVS